MNKSKLLSLDNLDELNIGKLKYFKLKLKSSSTPVPLFYSDGKFNDNNWNSGEVTPIRELINKTQYDRIPTKHYDFDLQYWEADINVYGNLFTTYNYVEDYTYFQITVDGKTYNADTDEEGSFVNQYMIKIYKNQGSIHNFIKNGKPITRNEYLSLLHILQSVGLLKMEESQSAQELHDYFYRQLDELKQYYDDDEIINILPKPITQIQLDMIYDVRDDLIKFIQLHDKLFGKDE